MPNVTENNVALPLAEPEYLEIISQLCLAGHASALLATSLRAFLTTGWWLASFQLHLDWGSRYFIIITEDL